MTVDTRDMFSCRGLVALVLLLAALTCTIIPALGNFEDCNAKIPADKCEKNSTLQSLADIQECLLKNDCIGKDGGLYTITMNSSKITEGLKSNHTIGQTCGHFVKLDATNCATFAESACSDKEEAEKEACEMDRRQECEDEEDFIEILETVNCDEFVNITCNGTDAAEKEDCEKTHRQGCEKYDAGEKNRFHYCPMYAPACYSFDGACTNACRCPPKKPSKAVSEDEKCVLIYIGLREDDEYAEKFCDDGDFSFTGSTEENVTGVYIGEGKRVILFSEAYNYGEPYLVLTKEDGPLVDLSNFCVFSKADVPSARDNGTNCEYELSEDGTKRVYSTWNDQPVSMRIEDGSTEFQAPSSATSLLPLMMTTLLVAIVSALA